MIHKIIHYDAPILRKKGLPIVKFTPQLKKLAEDMLETMRDAQGVGLAAQQIGHALQMAVIDITGVERPSKMWIKGKPVDPEDYMPLLLLNPILRLTKTKETGHEGCLSFPGLVFDLARPQRVAVKTATHDGGVFEFEAAGLLGRAIQHETDHLNGKLYIDHLSPAERREIKEDLACLKRGEPLPQKEEES